MELSSGSFQISSTAAETDFLWKSKCLFLENLYKTSEKSKLGCIMISSVFSQVSQLSTLLMFPTYCVFKSFPTFRIACSMNSYVFSQVSQVLNTNKNILVEAIQPQCFRISLNSLFSPLNVIPFELNSRSNEIFIA